MSILDLQGLHFKEEPKGPPPGSRGSKGCTVGGGGGGGEAASSLSILCEVLSP